MLQIFTDKQYQEESSATGHMLVPIVTQKEYQVIEISDDEFLSLMDANGNLQEPVRVPYGEPGKQITCAYSRQDTLCHHPLRHGYVRSF
ncbi:hypothetical protein IAR50_003223 [Cryptococcus sp. DSM 104548]